MRMVPSDHFLRVVRAGGIRKQILFESVRFWSVFCGNDSPSPHTPQLSAVVAEVATTAGAGSWRRAITNDSIYRRTFRIQRRGRCIVDGKGNHVSRLRGYRALVPDDGDVAI